MNLMPWRRGLNLRERRSNRFSIPLERLEIRQLLTWSASLVGDTATFTVGSASDTVTFSQSGGLLDHGTLTAPAGQSFASDLDFDSTLPGVQTLAASSVSTVDLNPSGTAGYAAYLGTDSSPASTLLAQFNLNGNAGSSVAIDDRASATSNTYTVTSQSIMGQGIQANFVGSPFGDGVSLFASDSNQTSNSVNILSTLTGEPMSILGGANVSIGDGAIDLSTSIGGSLDVSTRQLTVTPLDSSSATSTLTDSSLSGLTPLPIDFGPEPIDELDIEGGGGNNTFTVEGGPAQTILSTGTGTNTVNVNRSSPGLTVNNPGGIDQVNLTGGNALVQSSGGSTAIHLDRSADPGGTVTFSAQAANTGQLEPLGLSYSVNNNTSLEYLSGGSPNTVTLDFSNGIDVIPDGGLTYQGGSGDNTLVLENELPTGRFTNETIDAAGTGAGTISLDGSTINFSGLKPIIDTTPTANLTFNDQAGGDSQITVGPGGVVGGQQTNLISSLANPSQFEQVSYANKSNVRINAGPGNDVVSVVGYSLPSGTNTTIDGPAGNNVLNYYADGATVMVAPTGIVGQATITDPGLGSLLVENFQRINVIAGQVEGATLPPPPTFGSSPSVRGVDGIPLTNVDVATFTSLFLDATSASFGATINWGDGTSTAGTIVPDASDPTVFSVEGSHTYATPSPADGFSIGVTVNARLINTTSVPQLTLQGTSSASTTTTAVISDAALTAQGATIADSPTADSLIASFTYAGGSVPTSNFSGTVQWGDGTTSSLTSSDFIPVPTTASVASYEVVDEHTYGSPGTYPILVTIDSNFGSAAVASSTAIASAPVIPGPLNLNGTLNPASDSGVSDTDAIINDPRPNFYGSAAPGTHIELYAIPVGTTIAVPIGQAVANGVGAWSITSITMADGRYNIEAIGIDPTGVTSTLDVILPNALQGPLVVDTVAPKVESVVYKPLSGRVIVTFQDDSSGLDEAQVIDGANFTFTRVAALPGQAKLTKGPGLPLPSSYLVTSLSTSPQVDPAAPQVVTVTINKGAAIRGGYYRVTIKSGGIEDVAGNALDGEFYGDFPSGNNQAGGNFVANLNSIHNTVEPPLPVTSSASPLIPPGTKPKATSIPTVHAQVVTKTAVKSETTLGLESKTRVIHGKAKPKVTVASTRKKSALRPLI
jgi:hypothetical protein